MKIIKTLKFVKAYGPSVDDQPGFTRRDVESQDSLYGINNATPDSEQDIIDKWKNPQKKKRKKTELEKCRKKI
jgi:hypothetical protein